MKAVVFDFDGTITYKSKNLWKMIWQECGFDVGEGSLYEKYFLDYRAGKYDYQEWCDKTCELFRNKNFNHAKFVELSSRYNIIDGFNDVVKYLKDRGASLHVLSGSMVEGIKIALKEKSEFFDNICANKMIFDKDGLIERIDATNFDYIGKAEYIKALCKKLNCSPREIVFIGNDDNDDEVYTSGCVTVCFNPNKADYKNREKWHFLIENSSNFNDLMKILTNL